MGGIERGASFPRSTMVGREGKRAAQGKRREGVFIPPPKKIAIALPGRIIPLPII
jgi:hypothetical protein